MHVAINALCITNRSGTGRYAHGLVDGLMRIDTGGARFSVFVPSNFVLPLPWRNHSAFVFYSVPIKGAISRIVFEQFRLPSLLHTILPDVLHSPAFIAPVDAPLSIRQIVTIHDLAFHRYSETVPSLRLAYYRWAIPRSMKCASAILTDADTISQQIIDKFGLQDKLQCVPLGVDTRVFHSTEPDQDSAVLNQYRISQPYILFVGALEPRKNLSMLLKAFNTAREQGFDHTLVLAGRYGWLEPKSMCAHEGVVQTGYVSDEHLPALYRGASALAAPSIDEGFNLPATEALACGAAVVASDIAVHRETLGARAVYVSPHDVEGWAKALLTLKEDKGGLRTHSTVRDWVDVAKDTLDVYRGPSPHPAIEL